MNIISIPSEVVLLYVQADSLEVDPHSPGIEFNKSLKRACLYVADA